MCNLHLLLPKSKYRNCELAKCCMCANQNTSDLVAAIDPCLLSCLPLNKALHSQHRWIYLRMPHTCFKLCLPPFVISSTADCSCYLLHLSPEPLKALHPPPLLPAQPETGTGGLIRKSFGWLTFSTRSGLKMSDVKNWNVAGTWLECDWCFRYFNVQRFVESSSFELSWALHRCSRHCR